MPADALTARLRQALAHSFARGQRTRNAFLCGVFTAFSLPPFNIFPLLLLTIPWLLQCLRCADSRRTVFLCAWSFGSGYFLASMYWTTSAFFEILRDFPIFIPVSVIGLPAGLGLLWACALAGAALPRQRPAVFTLTVAFALGGTEYIRAHLNMPWAIFSSTVHGSDLLLQSSAVLGPYGLTTFVFLTGAIPFLAVHCRSDRAARHLMVMTMILFTAFSLWGWARLGQPPAYAAPDIYLLQPSIPQAEKSDTLYGERHLRIATDLMDQALKSASGIKPSLVLFPETFLTHHRDQDEHAFSAIASHLPSLSYAAVGVRRIVPRKGGQADIFNSLLFLTSKGERIDVYDKMMLAPGGETIPYEDKLKQSFLGRYLQGYQSLRAGPEPRIITLEGLPSFTPQICYEAAYPGQVPSDPHRPDFILLAVNDDWTMGTTQPYQGLAYAKTRAVETGLPVMRAANSGISAIIDGKGRILSSLPLQARGVLQSALPIAEPPTFYARYGDIPFLAILGIWILSLAGSCIRTSFPLIAAQKIYLHRRR